jgi:hypothetical protein
MMAALEQGAQRTVKSEVFSHVDAIVEYDSNYHHDLGQVFASDLSSKRVCTLHKDR